MMKKSLVEQTLNHRVLHGRAIDALVWGMPLLQFKGMRDSLKQAVGAGLNDICYASQIQNWKFQYITPNTTTPYILFFWNVEDGPVVIEIPPTSENGVGIFGTLMDAWQRALEDVGAKGKDAGRGGTYLVVPPGYNGPVLEGATTLHMRTYNGFAALRPVLPDNSAETLAEAIEVTKQCKVYPLAQAGAPPANRYLDIYDKNVEGIMPMNEATFGHLHQIIEEEVVQEQDLAMMGTLASLGIEKGKPFEPDEIMQRIFAKAGRDALDYVIEHYHRIETTPVYDDPETRWRTLAPPGVRETGFTWEYPNRVALDRRAAYFYAVCTTIKNPGAATYYLALAEDPQGQWLDGSNSYKLVIPADVPAADFWAVTAYDLESAGFIREMSRCSIDSMMPQVSAVSGEVEVYFGPTAPDGEEAFWIPTATGRRFFLLFRFYGPLPAALDHSWQLNDIERL